MTIFRLLARAGARAAAITCVDGREITYGDLLDLTGRHLEYFRRAGIGRGDRIAILTQNGPEAAVAFLSAACAAAAAPLNPAYGARELEFYLSDLRPKALLVGEGLETPAYEVAPRLGIPVLLLDRRTFELRGATGLGATDSASRAEAHDTALLLHTSGTTSRPKLVPLTHRNLCASARNVAASLALSPQDRCLNPMPLFHIHGLVGALLSTFTSGGSVIAAPGLRIAFFFEWLDHLAPTWYTAVPTMHQTILSRFDSQSHRLRLVRSSSSALPPSVLAGLERAFGVPVIEAYGMTEAAHQMASNPLPPAARKPGSVGTAAGPEIRVIDGEVCIRGENVTAGYEANPSANAGAFVDGWFRTGDQGYFDADGYLFLTGRIKELINRGGEKIAPREIDEVVMEHPGVHQAAAFAVPHARLGEDVGVAVAPRAGWTVTEREIVEFCAVRLADFKVPRVVALVDAIPKGPTGKLQRIGLAQTLGIASIGEPALAETAGLPPQTPAEELLQAIWSEVLRIPPPGVDRDFFACGGDSLTAAQVVFRVQEELSEKLPLVLFRTDPTIRGMSAALERQKAVRGNGVADGLIAIRPAGSAPTLFCVPPHDGVLLGIANLARHLSADVPVLACAPPQGGALETVEALARRYVSAVRTRLPYGPYRLLGHCFGGLIAVEMARILAEEGGEVELLTLVECYNPHWFTRLGRLARAQVRARHLLRRAWFHAGRTLRAENPAEYLWGRLRVVRARRRERKLEARFEAALLDGRVEAVEQFVANRVAGARYTPQTYAGTTLLLAPAHPRARRYPAPLLGWQGILTGNVSLFEIPDDLLGLFEEPAVIQAAACLDRALGAERNAGEDAPAVSASGTGQSSPRTNTA